MTKVKFINAEDIIIRVDNFTVEKRRDWFLRYTIYAKDKNGYCLDCIFRQTMWGVNRYINKMTRKKEQLIRKQGKSNGH